MIREWRHHFDQVTLNQGYRYTNHFQVKQVADDHYRVYDKETYDVYLRIVDGRIYESECSCQSQGLCAHVAAVLIYLEHPSFFTIPSTYLPQTMVASMDTKTKDRLLMALFSCDYEQLDKMVHQFPRQLKQVEIFRLQDLFESNDLYYEVNDYLTTHLVQMYKEQHYDLVLGLLMQLHTRLKLLEDEALDFHYLELETMILDMFDDFLNLGCDLYEQLIFEHFMADYPRQSYLDFLFRHFKTRPYLEVKKSLLVYLIKKMSAIKGGELDYFLNDYLDKLYDVLTQLNDKASIVEVIKNFEHVQATQVYKIHYLLQSHQFTQAIQAIVLFLKREDLSRFTILKYQRILLELYHEQSFEDYKKQLIHIFLNVDPGDFDDYLKLKKLCDISEWSHIKQRLFTSTITPWRLYDILYSEGDYEMLLECVLNHNDSGYVFSHQNELHHIPSCMMIPFIGKLIARLYRYKDRQQHILLLLEYLKTFDEGTEVAWHLLEEMVQRTNEKA